MRDYCFVCGISRLEFSKASIRFDYHLKIHHNPWSYINFIYYMEKQGIRELNGLEQDCYEHFLKRKTDWIPIGFFFFLKVRLDTLSERFPGGQQGRGDDAEN